MASEHYEVRRSARRRTTMGIVRESGKLVVLVPDRMTPRQERELIPGLVSRFLEREASRRLPAADAELTARGRQLFAQYLAEPGRPVPELRVSWSSRQQQRWGSCTTSTGEIRLSDRLRSMPDWVADYVLVHELTHLLERNHSARFHELVARYPQTERAKGFLEGWISAQGLPAQEY
ncbi:MAG: M48 family metallopeptidase [Micropruina sp.]|uniref:M48 metallopeptidase family protein n=1 Tax=Micropruina sp. TaxID=2737536 RepID=UPI0039E5A8A5